MSNFHHNEESARESLEKLKKEVGPNDPKPHRGGYLTQDEYATLLFYFAGEEHESDVLDGMIASLANCSWAKTPQRELPVAGAVLALCDLFPDKDPVWRAAYPELFARVRAAMRTPASNDHWNDFHIAQWFILRRARRDEGVELIDMLLDRLAQGGDVAYGARRAIFAARERCKPFDVAYQKAVLERRARMVVQ